MKHKLVRITTWPISLQYLLKGQLHFMSLNNFEVYAISADGAEIDTLKSNEKCSHIVIPFTRRISILQDVYCLFKLIYVLKKIKPNIVHTHTPKAGFIGMLASRIAGIPICLHTVAGLPWINERGLKRKLYLCVEKITAQCAHKVYVNSRNLLLFMKNEKISPNKLVLNFNGTSNGIDINHFTVQTNYDTSQILKFNNESINRANYWIWLFVGRVVKDKGIEELLDAFEKHIANFKHDVLWIVGELEQDLNPIQEKYINILHNHSQIKYWGFQKDVRPFFQEANMLVFPSYREGFPNVPMQAALMDCGLILSNINGCNEIVQHQVNGLLVTPKSVEDLWQAMLWARTNPDLINEYKRIAKQDVSNNYDQTMIWQFLLSEYNYFINKKND